jgi:hypothetical protein
MQKRLYIFINAFFIPFQILRRCQFIKLFQNPMLFAHQPYGFAAHDGFFGIFKNAVERSGVFHHLQFFYFRYINPVFLHVNTRKQFCACVLNNLYFMPTSYRNFFKTPYRIINAYCTFHPACGAVVSLQRT